MGMETRRLGKYELRERLARGGQGEVWKAYDPQLRRYVAIKQLHTSTQDDSAFNARFEREAQFIASLHHPNIVQIHDFQFIHSPDSNTSTAYMVMEFIDGPTLADYIRSTSRQLQFPSASDIVTTFTSVSLALDYAHQKGMIHRDIKPANIMLDRRNPYGKPMGEPILMDFGIAKLQGAALDTTRALGTPLYVSPEQAQGATGDHRSDLYSLGIILYEITTGVTPFRGASLMEVLMRHYQDIPTPPSLINPDISPELSHVILKSIAKDPDARFPTASAMTIALAESLDVPVPPDLLRSSTTYATIADYAVENPLSLPREVTTTNSATESNAKLPPPQSSLLPAPKPERRRKRPGRSFYFISLLSLMVLLALGLGLARLLPRASGQNRSVTQNAVGHVLFLNSQNSAGVLDEVQITVENVHDAAASKDYYAWLETHNDNIMPEFWTLTPHSGSISSAYVDPQHQNLLTRFPYLLLITLQSKNANVASFDPAERLYYAVIPQATSATDSSSIVDHLNALLTDDPTLDHLKLSHGSIYWLLANIKALLQEVNSVITARQSRNIAALRQHLVDSLYYLDGTCTPSYLQNSPQGTPGVPDTSIAPVVTASLLDCPQDTLFPGMLTHIGEQTQAITQAPAATREQQTLVPRLQTEMAQLNAWLQQLHQDTLQLIRSSDAQLLQPSTLSSINQMVTLANEAYDGQHGQLQGGAVKVSRDTQQLATFDILPCPQSGTNTICMS